MKRFWKHIPFKFRFSARMIGVYSGAVLAPIMGFSAFTIAHTWQTATRMICIENENSIAQNASQVASIVQTVHAMETTIYTNDDLLFFLLKPEEYTQNESIGLIREQISNIERTLAVSPVYAVRIFVKDESIAERWPVILHQSRADVSALNYWTFDYTADYMGNQNSAKHSSVCATQKLFKSKHAIGWLQVAVEMTDFFPFLFSRKDVLQNDYVYAVDRSGGEVRFVPAENVAIRAVQGGLSARELVQVQALYAAAPASLGKIQYIDGGQGKKMVAWTAVPAANVVLVHTYSMGALRTSTLHDVLVTAGVLLLSAMLIFLLVKIITTRMLKGVYSLMDGMEQVQRGNLTVQVPVSAADEVGLAQRNFNMMTEQLRNQVEQIRIEQQMITDTEMKALQNQINAHFLYNVLETIRMQAELYDAEPVAESIIALGKMMRYSLRWRVHTVTLAKEIEYIRSYIYILNVRNDYEITLDVAVPPQFLETEIPKMFLQPLVENAFYHAIEPVEQDATVKIYTSPDEAAGKLWLCVQDFGCGMTAEQVDATLLYLSQKQYEQEAEGHIGIKNIQQRLFMFYGETYMIQIDSAEGKGTTIRIPVPLPGGQP